MKFASGVMVIAASLCFFGACKKSSSGKGNVHIPQPYQLILRPDASTGQDTYVAKIDVVPTDGNTNLNSTNELCLARWNSGFQNDSAAARGFIRFVDLAKVPSTATVTNAMLYLYGEGPDSSTSFAYGDTYPEHSLVPNGGYVQLVTGGSWDQSTLTWNNAPAATATGEDTIAPSTTSWNYNVAVDVTNLVKQQVGNPSLNFGFLLKLRVELGFQAMEFASSECPDSLERPKLVVNYTY